MSGRNHCFTLNNYTKEELEEIKAWECNYLVIGFEVGKEKTPHLQCYVEWGKPKRFSTLKRINSRIHWERRKGTAKQASDYCKKDGLFIEFGVLSNQGKRTDILAAAEAIMAGDSMKEVALDLPTTFIKYHRGLEKFKYEIQEDRAEKPHKEMIVTGKH